MPDNYQIYFEQMKIGLLTYHHSVNIGAMMQAYATCRALRELGHDVVIVDIRQPEGIHSGITKMITDVVYLKRDAELRRFKAEYYPPMTRRYFSVEELRRDPPEVDCLLVGSDQTWNPGISKEMAMAYFLDFGPADMKRVSYGSSFGIANWPEDSNLIPDVRNALRRFNSISVREATGKEILHNTFGVDGQIVVDPTMLFNNYNEITGTITPRNELVCYKLERNQDFYDSIGAVKHKAGLPARLLNNSFPVNGLRYTYPPGVQEWICRLGGAAIVLTDSFHGVVFSLLYKRNFVAIKSNNGKDSRIVDLMREVGLQGRLYDGTGALLNDDSWLKPIDYSEVEPVMSRMRTHSWDYLKTSLAKR